MMASNHNQASERAYWEPKPVFEDPLYKPTFYASFIDYESDFREKDVAEATELNNRFIAEIPDRLIMFEEFLNRHEIGIAVGANDYTELEHFIIDNVDNPHEGPFGEIVRSTEAHLVSTPRVGISQFWASIMIDFTLHILYKKQELSQFPIVWHTEPRSQTHREDRNYVTFKFPGSYPSTRMFMFGKFVGWAEKFTDEYTTKYRYWILNELATTIDKAIERAGHAPVPRIPIPRRTRRPSFILKNYELSPYTRFFTNHEEYSDDETMMLSQTIIDNAANRSDKMAALLKEYNINIDLSTNNLEELEVFLIHHIEPHANPEKEFNNISDQWVSFMTDFALYCGQYKIAHNENLKWKIATQHKRAQPVLPVVQYKTYRRFIFEDFIGYGRRLVWPGMRIPAPLSSQSLSSYLQGYETKRVVEDYGYYFPIEKFAHFQ
jgi:hypothetical protein